MAHMQLYASYDTTLNSRSRIKRDLLRVAVNKLRGLGGGAERGGNFTLVNSGTDPATACSAGIGSGNSGTVGITINGVTNNVSTGASDAATQALIAAAINASSNALVQYLVGASTFKSSLTLVTVVAGETVKISDWLFTAVAGTAASIPTVDGQFVAKGSGTDTQSGTSLSGAINRHPAASKYIFALNVAGVVHVFAKTTTAAWFTGPFAPQNNVVSSSSTISVGSATFVASDYCGVWCKVPGKLGNAITIAAVGTGQSIENTNTRLTRGVGGDAAPVTETI